MASKKKQTKGKSKATKKKQTKALPYRKNLLGFLFVFSFLLYANTITHDYAFDDSIVITENTFTQQGIKGIKSLLSKELFEGMYGSATDLTGGRYRPLSLVTYAIEYELFGLNPTVGHLSNVLLHSLMILLLFLVLERLFPPRSYIPFIATLLFMVHPLHTEVVANIKSRDALLCFSFLLGTIYAGLNYLKQEKIIWLLLMGISYFLALLAKETALTFLVLIPLTFYVFKDVSLKQLGITLAPIFLFFILYMIIRTSVAGAIGGSDSTDIMENPFILASFSEKFATIFLILLKYLGLLFFPHPMSSDYSFNQIPYVGWSNIFSILGLVLYLAMGIYAAVKILKKDKIAYGIFFYLIPLSITSNIVFNIGAPMADRFLFMPSLGFCLIVAILLKRWFKLEDINSFKLNVNWIPVALVALVVFAFSIKTVLRNKDWYDNLSLFKRDIQFVPNSAKAQYYYGNTLLKRYLDEPGQETRAMLDEADASFQQCVTINPEFHWCWYNLGQVADQKGEGQRALQYLNKTLEIQPNHIKTHTLLGRVYGRLLNNPEKSIYHLQKGIEFGEDDVSVYMNLGNAYAMKGALNDALNIFQKALEREPNHARLHLNIGITYQQLGQGGEAQKYFDKAFALDPSLKQ